MTSAIFVRVTLLEEPKDTKDGYVEATTALEYTAGLAVSSVVSILRSAANALEEGDT